MRHTIAVPVWLLLLLAIAISVWLGATDEEIPGVRSLLSVLLLGGCDAERAYALEGLADAATLAQPRAISEVPNAGR